MPLSKKLGAEFIGTFWLVLGGCGSAVLAAKFPEIGIGLVGVALAFGLIAGIILGSLALNLSGWAQSTAPQSAAAGTSAAPTGAAAASQR